MTERYIGIENELISFKDGQRVGFYNYFDKLKGPDDYSKSDTSIRTKDGLGFYVDGGEIEILTPPITINHGFASRLTDSVVMGRNKIINATPELLHTGYSMHWNLTRMNKESYSDFLKGIAIPFHLFGLTPVSVGLNIREKRDDYSNRFEILGDSLVNVSQINATALLLGSYNLAFAKGWRPPFSAHGDKDSLTKKLFLPDGRYNKITVSKKDGGKISTQAQHVLEPFYQWLEPVIREVGTKEEIKNLERFVTQDQKLEFDWFKYFAYILDENGKKEGAYQPIKACDASYPSQIIRVSETEPSIPLEGILLGELVKRLNHNLLSMDWGQVEYGDENGDSKSSAGIEKIFTSINEKYPDLPQYQGTSDISKLIEPVVAGEGNYSGIKYSKRTDVFEDTRKKRWILSFVLDNLKEKGTKKILTWIGVFVLLAGITGGIGSWVYDELLQNRETKQIMQSAQTDGGGP